MGLMPSGLRGLMVAVMMAALMSSLTSVFNSSSALFTMDIWRKVRREAREKELVIVGKAATVLLVLVSVIWVPILQRSSSGQLYTDIQSVTSHLAPPVTAVFLLAVFWMRANEQGAFWGLLVGLAVGLSRMALELAYPVPRCGVPDTRPALLRGLHYLHFALCLCLLTAVVVVGVSLLTEPPAEAQVKEATWWTRRSPGVAPSLPLSAPPSLPDGLCGTGKEAPQEVLQLSSYHGEGQEAAARIKSETESSFWSQVCSVNAMILICINLFFYGFFA